MKLRRIWKVFITLIIIGFLCGGSAFVLYNYELSAVDKSDDKDIVFTVEKGSTTKKIGKDLKSASLIHDENFFILYMKLNNISNLQASTYKLKRSMDLKEIVSIINKGEGYNPDEIKITFKEGKNIRSVAKVISENTNNKENAVIEKVNNKEYVDSLIKKYWFLKEDVKNKDIYYSLEGYLFPNTYVFKNKDVTVEEIFEKMLDETDKVLTKYKKDITSSKYSVHEIITMASIVELEGLNDSNRPDVASVFYNRLDKGISLGSDVTACYAQKIDDTALCHKTANFNYPSKYNTRVVTNLGLPVGPICNPSESSIKAAIYPNKTNYMFFVADKNTKLYFFKTKSEFEKKIKELKQSGNWL